MRNLRWIVAASALSFSLTTGCKKETPPAAAPAPAAKPEEKKPEEKPAEAKPEEKAPEAKPAEPAPTEAKPAEPAPTEPAPTEPTAEVKPADAAVAAGALGAGIAEVPADAIAVGAIPGVDALFDLVKGKAEKFGVPLPMAKEQILETVKTKLGLTAMDWLDTTKPLQMVVWNPKTTEGPVLLIPITGKDKLVAALPADKKENEQGNEFALTVEGKTAFLNFVEGYVAVSPAATAFGSSKDFVAKLGTFAPQGEADFRVATGNLRTIFADQIAAFKGQAESFKAMAKQQLNGNPELGIPAALPGLSGLDGIVDWYFDLAMTVVDETDGIGMSADLDDAGNVTLPLTVRYKPDGKIAAFAKALEGADLSFANAAPANSYMVFAGEIDPKAMTGLMDFSTNMLATFLSLSEEEKATVKKHIEDLVAISGKKSWFSLYSDGNFPLAMAGAAHVTDGKRYKEIYDAYTGMIFTKALAKVKELLPPQFQQNPIDSFSKLIELANGITSNMGLNIAAVSADVDGIATWKLAISVDLAKLAALPGADMEEIKKITDLVGTSVEFGIAFGTDKVGMAFGPNGVANALSIAKGTFAGGTDTSKWAKSSAMLLQFDFGKGLAAFKPLLAAGGKTDLPEIAEGTTAGFSIGAETGALSMSLFGNADAFVKLGMDVAKRDAAVEAPPVEGGAVPAPEGGAAAPEGGAVAPAPEGAAPAAPAEPAAGGAKGAEGVVPQ
ncbi:MAG: hypothetical protein IV100_20845 [Myxococcales bacterium]|nr:hypothetical protein [Myxococcales bacterium]